MNAETAKGRAVRRGLELAFEKVVEQHRQWREPLILWRNGKVVHQPVAEPYPLYVAEEADSYDATPKPTTNRSEQRDRTDGDQQAT